jgi:serine-type D-Ala-D-Ala carboxypeptidase/endopeptidase (penicillin-binding protein 4)
MSMKRIINLTAVFPILYFLFSIPFSSCSVQKQLSKTAKADVLDNKALQAAHVGISIFDPAANKYLYNYQGDKYFVPASNTKLPTCYAAMKYLGDSLIGMRSDVAGHTLRFFPTGDPTFLLAEFKYQPVFDFLKKYPQSRISISTHAWQEQALGSGWAWNDFKEYYMAERSFMPIYGNMVEFSGTIDHPKIFPHSIIDSIAIEKVNSGPYLKSLERNKTGNVFKLTGGNLKPVNHSITFDTKNGESIKKLLKDTLGSEILFTNLSGLATDYVQSMKSIKSQPTDSVLKPMMHRSDNFFAEQMLLMVSNEKLGIMTDSRVIDTLLKTDFNDLPQKPRWVDGSGLSRYNLFTPQDFVAILNKMKNEFGMERLKVILPTGGEGTISNYYKLDSGYIYGKTGTLSGVVAFSGFLYTKKGKLLIFSTLINNHQASATDVRRAVEKFIQGVRNKY